VLLVLFVLLIGIFVGTLQLPQSKEYFKNEVETTFNEQFQGTLSIGDISGFLPFTARVENGNVYAPGDSLNPVLSFDTAEVKVTWWELLQQNLVISSFRVSSPSIHIGFLGDEIGLSTAFKQNEELPQPTILDDDGTPRLLTRISIFAPYISVSDGQVDVDTSIQLPENLHLPSPFHVENLNFTVFLEVTETEIFFDLPDFIADIPDSPYDFVQLSGQFYNDNRYFELNRFRLVTNLGSADFSFEASPVNLFRENLKEQFESAAYRFQITESAFSSELIRQFADTYPDFDEDLELELISEGTADEYFIDRLQANIGESSILISGQANQIFTPSLSYIARLDNMVIHPDKLDWISDTYFEGEYNLERYQLSTIRGELAGTYEELTTDFKAETQAGSFLLDGRLAFDDPLTYDLVFEVDTLDITPFLADTVNSSVIQGRITLNGTDTGENTRFTSTADLSQSQLFGHNVDSFIAELVYDSHQLNYDISGGDSELFVSARGLYARDDGQNRFITEGEVRNFDIKAFFHDFHADTTNFNTTFSTNLEWTSQEDLTGRVSFEIEPSLINQDTLRSHQFYADLQDLSDNTRRLRITSSFFDGEISGNLQPAHIRDYAKYWTTYLQQRVGEEFLFDTDYFEPEASPSYSFSGAENASTDLSIEMTVKDLTLFRKYVPELPDLESSARLTASINASEDRFLITGNLLDQHFQYGDFSAENFNAAFTGSFRHDSKLSESNTVDLQVSSGQSAIRGMNLKESYLNISMRNDSLGVTQRFERLDDDLRLESAFTGYLRPDKFEMVINQLAIGTSDYDWMTEGQPVISYTDRKSLDIDGLVLISDSDYLEINGTYSTETEDAMEYTVRNFNLSRISDLIGGRIRFSGTMNGEFITQTLTQIPSIQGDISVEEGRIQDRLIGDVTLNSEFNPETNQFDTEIHVFTDPEKYPRYYERNEGIGQDLFLTGYFKLPDETTGPDEELFYFDADLRQVDMWIVTFIIPNILPEVEGSSTGQGFIRGTRNDYDFSSTFQITDVYAKPAFTNVEYTLNGELDFNRNDGLLFKDIELRDTRNGTGLVYGQIDLDDFSPVTILNLTLDLNDLHFMNNPYDPDIPFYGSIYGTGQTRITGTNFSPVLRTSRPIVLSSRSQISIPLEPEIEFEQDRRFIQFVESFDLPFWERQLSRVEREAAGEERIDLTFLELFTMDLQFQANNPTTVRLIFDPVTNDILNASGTGQVRVLLEDQDVSMFGRFNITGGDYQFVSGDIFTRRFNLQQGGSISWSGDLVDASLNVTAVYRARPNISTLMSVTGPASGADPGQRIPIELVLHIGGTITAVENDFFFRVPTGIESTVDPAISSQISNLNQNEDEKLIQATSILLSGNFIPSSQAQGLGLAEGFSGTAAVVNPLITSQVINPLLSNQINSLLRSDITFDIDFNLTAFNEVDLGVALRLFDDRVILRREGQITGEQSDIGDIGATYRINRTFSVTAFHRQDPTLAYTSGVETRQAQEMNGVGVEAQVQFNTWQSLRARISSAFRTFFGIKKENEETENESLADQIKPVPNIYK
jgi:translocation and assembly module TamB